MIKINELSDRYSARRLGENDIQSVYELQLGNPLYYKFCPPFPSVDEVKKAMLALPPNKEYKDKHYIGFFEGDELIAVMDLITSYPDCDSVFIGFFMMKKDKSGKGIGSSIIEATLEKLKMSGFKRCRLGYMKGNMQSRAFWHKCGFLETGIETENGQGLMVVLEKNI